MSTVEDRCRCNQRRFWLTFVTVCGHNIGMTNTQSITSQQSRLIRFHLQAIDTADGCRELLATAQRRNMYEADIISRWVSEAERDIDDTFDAMCDAGVTPEMLEQYVDSDS